MLGVEENRSEATAHSNIHKSASVADGEAPQGSQVAYTTAVHPVIMSIRGTHSIDLGELPLC